MPAKTLTDPAAGGTTDSPRLLRWRDVQQQIPISRSSWYAGVKEGRFPQPVKIGPKTSAWLQSDIDKFIARLAAQ